jgi:hypothetical protein
LRLRSIATTEFVMPADVEPNGSVGQPRNTDLTPASAGATGVDVVDR